MRYVFRNVMGASAAFLMSGCALDMSGEKITDMEPEATALLAESANLEMARSAYNNGRYGIVISHLERELAVRPESVAALNGLGAAYDQIGRFEVAQRYYFRALELAADPTTTLANLGYSRQLQGKPEEAAQILDLALYYGPHNAVANANMQAVVRQLASQPSVEVTTTNTISEPATIAMQHALRVEVSNGSGINGMAARVSNILQERSVLLAAGGDVVRLTNADSFTYITTTVYYRRGRGEAVAELLNSLPLQNLRLEETDQLAPDVDVRVLLGSDYIPYDSRG